MRTLSSLIAISLLTACQKEPDAPPPAPPPSEKTEPAPEKVDVVGEPVTFEPLTPGAVCTYELKEVLTESLGDQLFAGHDVTLKYTLRARQSEAKISFEAEVTHVKTNARRETYNVKLDSQNAGDLKRVQGGADTLVMYEMVVPFAFLGKRVTFELDDRGYLIEVKGGDAVRQAMLEMHPPKPRKDPHYQKKVEVVLSDRAIAEWLFPSAAAMPEDGPFASGRQETKENVTFDLVEYVGRGSSGFRMAVRPERWLFEEKGAFVSVKEVPSIVPPLSNQAATVDLLNGDRSLTVEFEPKNPCFRRAGSSFNDLAVWAGEIEEVKTTTERKRSITRIWTKK